jgi:hypothetical protein
MKRGVIVPIVPFMRSLKSQVVFKVQCLAGRHSYGLVKLVVQEERGS